MSLATLYSRAGVGTDAPIVTVEVHLSRGLPSCAIVGLPETAVKESRDRVRGAIINSGFEFPKQRIVVNLAPADLPKEGGRFDLPIALGVLVASGQIKNSDLSDYVFLGELALSGELRSVRGALIAALSLRNSEKTLVLPPESGAQAALAENVNVVTATTLSEVSAALNGMAPLLEAIPPVAMNNVDNQDLSNVIGQQFAKRAIEIAAAGHHSLLMSGPPGAGKTMLASHMTGIMPEMTESEALESAAIASISTNGFDITTWKQRPFRAPHHGTSGAALIGGGSIPRPGEISLSHNGILFLDELPEFGRQVLEMLREPMESGRVNISRSAGQCSFLSDFLLIAAANPCPCGYFGDPDRCRCSPEQISRYQSRLSGPLLDRIDMHLEIKPVPTQDMRSTETSGETNQVIRERVNQARRAQLNRQGKTNSALDANEIKQICVLTKSQTDLLYQVVDRFKLSTRAIHRILKLSRTIADLKNQAAIENDDLLLAVKLRGIERQ